MNSPIFFIVTFSMVSITPGMCMLLALTLGLKLGHSLTLWMMLGEIIGVTIVATTSAIGAATIMLQFPEMFVILKYCGGMYLLYLAIQLWLSKGSLAIHPTNNSQQKSKKSGNLLKYSLINQGFITAIVNPKGWAFFIALLPPFLNSEQSLAPQLAMLIGFILIIEFASLNIYCLGGQFIGKLIANKRNVKLINRISGSLMAFVAAWLAFG